MRHILLMIICCTFLMVAGCGPGEPQKTVHDAVASRDVEDVKRHVAAGSDLNEPGPSGDTPCHVAIKMSAPTILRMLVENGADTTKKGLLDKSIFEVCLGNESYSESLDLLIELNAKGTDEDLYHAAWDGHAGLVAMLIKQECDPNYTRSGIDVHTPLLAATAEGHDEVVRLLLDAGADKSVRTHGHDSTMSAEQLARKKGFTKIAEMLASD